MISNRPLHAFLPAVILILATLALPARAAPDAAGAVRVPVENQQPGPREEALRGALEQILVQLTGRDDVASLAQAAELLKQPSRFVQRYSYESGAQGLTLSAQFDTGALRRALRQAGVAVWETSSAPVLVWLAVERPGERLLVGTDETPALRAQLESAARRRGVALMFPLLDAEDRRRASFTDVFGGFQERVLSASSRYGTPLVLMGRVHREAGEWVARWNFSHGTETATWLTAAPQLEGALEQGVRELAQRLSAQQAAAPLSGVASADLLLRIAGIGSVRDFARMEQYLRQIGGVRDVQALQIKDDTVVVRLDLEVDSARVLRVLDGGHTLIRMPVVPAVTGAAAAGAENSYQLRP